MTGSGSPRAERDGGLVTQAAAALLGRVPALAERAARAVAADVPAYRGRQAPEHEDLVRAMTAFLTRLLQVLAGAVPDRDDPLEEARAIGRRRSAQRVPLEALQRAEGVVGQVLWQAFVEQAARWRGPADPDATAELVAGAGQVWTTLAGFSAASADAYRRSEQEAVRREERRRGEAVEVLLAAPPRSLTALGKAARVLGLPERGRFVVVASDPADTATTRRLRVDALTARGLAPAWVARPDGDVGLVALGAGEADAVVSALAEVLPGRAAVSPPVEGLTALARAHRLARAVLTTLGQDETLVVPADERMPEALVAATPELSERLVEAVLGPVLALPSAERDVLVTTLEHWLAVDGSAAAAAERLYCHRNTVLNRLHRFEGLTGRSLDRTRDVVTVALALGALRQRRDQTGSTVVLPGEGAGAGAARRLHTA